MNLEFKLPRLSCFYPVAITDFGLCGVFTSVQNCYCYVLIVCWPLNCLWVWKWVLILLDKSSVCRSLIDRDRGLDFFFTPPEQHQKGRHSLRDCVAEKVMLSCVGCVDVLEARLDLVQVSIALWLSSLAQQSAFPAPLQPNKPNYVGLTEFL